MAQEPDKLSRLAAWLLPLLAAGYSVINFLETNITEARPADAGALLGGMLLYALGLFVLLRLLRLTIYKAALLSTLILICSLYGGMPYLLIRYMMRVDLPYVVFVGLLVMLVGGIGILLAKSRASFKLPVLFLAIAAAVGLGSATANVTLYEMGRPNAADLAAPLGVTLETPKAKRNIYYIILDRYAAARTLAADYDFDNGDFTSFLRKSGFYVADNSVSNYPKTAQSISSSLNMDYHHFTADQIPKDKSDWLPFHERLRHNRVTALLKGAGYKYIHMGSWWPATASSPMADENFQTTLLSQFALKYLQRSLFDPLLHMFYDKQAQNSLAPDQCNRVPRKFAHLTEVAKGPKPVFVFAHFLIPHDPFVFDKTGHCLTREESAGRSLIENYLGQLQYGNQMIRALVDQLLTAPGPKPISIIQADEGPFPVRYRRDEAGFQWKQATDQEFRQKMRILNAYYFPETDPDIFYDSITPVNSFRLLFNRYFGAELPLLADRNYAFPNAANRFDFFDVTDIVR